MTTIFEPKIDFSPEVMTSNNYDDFLGLVPPDDFVVSRKRDGSIASRYGDMTWDYTAYDTCCRLKRLHFPYWKDYSLTPVREHLSREARWLMFLLIWKRVGSSPLSFSSLEHFMSLQRSLAKYCEINSSRIKDVLTDVSCLISFTESGISSQTICNLSRLLSTLLYLGTEQTGFTVNSGNVQKDLLKRIKDYSKSIKQHPPIPARIYSAFIAALVRDLNDFEAVAERYLALVVKCATNPLLGRCRESQYKVASKLELYQWDRNPYFEDILRKYDLGDYFSAKGLKRSVMGLSTGLGDVQMVAKLLIQTYSGMRDDESITLPYYSLETSTSNGKIHCLIMGRTTKMNMGLIKRTRWVTNQEGHWAIKVAQRIAKTIYITLGEKPRKTVSRINIYPLFVSRGYLPFTGSSVTAKDGIFLPSVKNLCTHDTLKERFLSKIEERDLCELEQIDPHRSWRLEKKFQVGHLWVLTTHQLRRSLALYAQRSGLVSLPSLRRQLQHITEEMSRYYARGSAFANNFISEDKEHFGREWQETVPVSAALSYIINVIYSDEVMFGGHADWVKNRLRGPDGIVMVDREATMRRFKKGELSYRETSLGGCTNIGECKQIAIKWLDVDCLSCCRNLVGRLSNLERVIVAQTRLVGSINPTSIEYRSEKADLDVLIATRDKALSQQSQCLEAI